MVRVTDHNIQCGSVSITENDAMRLQRRLETDNFLLLYDAIKNVHNCTIEVIVLPNLTELQILLWLLKKLHTF